MPLQHNFATNGSTNVGAKSAFLILRNETEAMSRQHVTKLYGLFKEGRTDTDDDERSGRPSVVSDESVTKIEETVRADPAFDT